MKKLLRQHRWSLNARAHYGQTILAENLWVPLFDAKSRNMLSQILSVTDYRRQPIGRQPSVAKSISDKNFPLLATTLSVAKSG